ncbi:Nickel and cobalt resistance protein CnrB [Pigmentiphaga humi]|uniref:Nickel and cobalt resistance protein CnrB n=1 Tax=Pigmentiphaga humi TaxID=2478468 RepID=A0A3P4B4Q8_9BURK|nr:efflux RND transporter periplasmic adaptor subunit [Pigmentiphaga humi]VCU71277.1 Nickel and cobalt resistance protein CnrB [Pigmentiphaga humi]
MSPRFSALLVACFVALSACSDKPQPAAPAVPEAQAPALPPGQVRIKPASLQYMEIQEMSTEGAAHVVWAPARVAFREEQVANVVAPVAGRILQIQAQIGDEVKAGAPLATLSSPDASRIRADYANAQVELRVAQAEAKRQRTMVEKGIGIEAELLVAEAKLQEAQHNVDVAARATSFLGGGGSDSLLLRAPRAGVVVSRNTTPGASVGPDAGALFTIGDPNALWINADVFESDLSAIGQGAEVQVVVPSLDRPLAGKVARVGSSLNAQTRRGQVYITLDQGNSKLRAGMLARAGIQARSGEGLSVPVNAVLIKDGSRSIVFVQVSDTVFEARTVALGQPSNGYIPVLSGLSAGDKVVVKGALLLDGSANQLL